MNLTYSTLLPFRAQLLRWLSVAVLLLAVLWLPPGRAHAQTTPAETETTGLAGTGAGPVRLRQPIQAAGSPRVEAAPPASTGLAKPSDFEAYVQKLAKGRDIQRFGNDLVTSLAGPLGEGADYNPLVPPDYLLRAGDELVVTLWGSVDADLRLQVDRAGRITIPRVGPVMVSGVRYADVPDVIGRRVAQVFKNYQISVTLGQLRGIRVYVTGFVARPGPVMLNGLSTLVHGLMRAGGPSAAGSFRSIQLRRGRDVVSTFDLYDLLVRGDRSADQLLQADDVIHVGPIGPQVALLGSVNRPAIFEIKPGETLDDLLRLAGGFSTVADDKRVTLERLDQQSVNALKQLQLPLSARLPLNNGDIITAFNAADLAQPTEKQSKRVRVEGEVAHPGEYVLPPASSIADALRAAGGVTPNAYVYGTEFTRESVRKTQQRNYERALRDFETQLASANATRRTSNAEEAAAASSATVSNSRLIEQLRTLKPNGRIVLQLPPSSSDLPDLALEDGDRLYLPPRPTTVGVFGSVFSTGSYLHSVDRTLGDYLRLAGGPTRGADESSVFVIKANGSVNSSLQESGLFRRGNQISGLAVDPGDTIFVPEEVDKTTFVQRTRDWTQIFFQLAVGLAGLKTATGF